MHSKNYVSRKAKMTNNWDGWSRKYYVYRKAKTSYTLEWREYVTTTKPFVFTTVTTKPFVFTTVTTKPFV